LTYKNFNTERVLRWRLIIEEYGPEFYYVKGSKNIVADALSRVNITPCAPLVHHSCACAEYYGIDTGNINFPLNYAMSFHLQQKDKTLQAHATSSPHYRLHSFHGGDNPYMLIKYKDKIDVSKILVNWYHEQLCHPGETRKEQAIRQHFWFPELRENVHLVCSKCPTYQKSKK
jgi:hypothetical protein